MRSQTFLFTPPQTIRKAGGQDAGGKGDQTDAENGDEPRHDLAEGRDRIDIAISNRGQRCDGPPEGAWDRPEGFGLCIGFGDVEHDGGGEQQNARHGNRGGQLPAGVAHSQSDFPESREHGEEFEQSEKAEHPHPSRTGPEFRKEDEHDDFRRKGEKIENRDPAEDEGAPSAQPLKAPVCTRGPEAQRKLSGKEDRDQGVNDIQAGPQGWRQGRLGLNRQQEQRGQDNAGDKAVPPGEAFHTGIEPRPDPSLKGSCICHAVSITHFRGVNHRVTRGDQTPGMSETLQLPPIAVFELDGAGGAAPSSLEDLPQSDAGSNGFEFVWIQLQRDNAEALEWLESGSDLDGFIREALTAEDTRPRCTVHGDGAIINLRGVNLHEGAEPEDMISLRLWVEKRRVVGVWRRPLYAVADLMASLERGIAPASPGDLVAKLALRLVDRMEPTVADLHEQIDDMEDVLDDPEASFSRSDLADLRRQAIILRRFISPQRDALNTLAIEDLDWLTERDRSRIREAADKTTRVAEELESVRERAAIVHDQLLERRAEQMNSYTLLLSVVAAIFLPLGLLTGLLGINVGGMPGANSPWAFWIVTASLVVIGLVLAAFFRRAKLI